MALVSIVVPVYHNAASLPDLLQQFQALAARNPADHFEFVCVDDGSQDNSLAVLTALARAEPRLRVVKLSRNFGSNPAILAGLSQAQGAAIAVIAADLQDPPELIHEMLALWRQGHKVILAARQERDDPGLTALMADAFYALFRRFAIKTMPRRGFDFFVIDRQVCDLVNNIQENNAYLMGLILWLGFDPQVLYYHRRQREQRYGASMWTLAKKLKYFVDSFVAFSYFPVRAASILGITLSLVGLLYALVVVAIRILYGVEVEGWTSMMVVLLVVSGAQMLIMGILGEYLWRNLDETRRRPRYIIDRVIGPAPAPTTDSPPAPEPPA
ncbi:MAG: glycosyltransferase family 2 protein [Anaerolineae bacterium]|nr:glycosyltransferase family 2 protein [Anaerolineae bacterium]